MSRAEQIKKGKKVFDKNKSRRQQKGGRFPKKRCPVGFIRIPKYVTPWKSGNQPWNSAARRLEKAAFARRWQPGRGLGGGGGDPAVRFFGRASHW